MHCKSTRIGDSERPATSPGSDVAQDGTRDVLVEIKDRVRAGRHLVPGTHVEIYGEVETRMFKEPKIEARSVTVLAQGDRPAATAPEAR